MRVLTIGIPLPNPAIDNYSLTSAPSFFEYEAVIVNPAGVSQVIEAVLRGEEDHVTIDDEPVHDGPTTPVAVGLADLIHRRRDETQRLLDRGGLLVCFAYPNVTHPRVSRFPGCERYSWLPAPPGLDWSRDTLLPGFGTEVLVTDYEHPFAPFIDRFRGRLAYRAYTADSVRGRVFARSAGGAPIGVEVAISQGRLVFLPSLRDPKSTDDRFEIAELLVQCCQRAVRSSVREGEPEWVEMYRLPDLDELRTAQREAELVLEAARSQVEQFTHQVERVARWRGLLWQEGRVGLLPLVEEAFGLLGFGVAREEDRPPTLLYEGQPLFLEVEGSTQAVDMAPHYRLRRRWEETLASTGQAPRGLVVVNGYRRQPPDDRPQQYQDALQVAAEAMRYCLMTSADLFQLVRWTLQGASEEEREAIRREIVETEGVFHLPDWVRESSRSAGASSDSSERP